MTSFKNLIVFSPIVTLACVLAIYLAQLPICALRRRQELAANAFALELTNDPNAFLRMAAKLSPAEPKRGMLARLQNLWDSHPPTAAVIAQAKDFAAQRDESIKTQISNRK